MAGDAVVRVPAIDSSSLNRARLGIIAQLGAVRLGTEGHAFTTSRIQTASEILEPAFKAVEERFRHPSSRLRIYGEAQVLAMSLATNATPEVAEHAARVVAEALKAVASLPERGGPLWYVQGNWEEGGEYARIAMAEVALLVIKDLPASDRMTLGDVHVRGLASWAKGFDPSSLLDMSIEAVDAEVRKRVDDAVKSAKAESDLAPFERPKK